MFVPSKIGKAAITFSCAAAMMAGIIVTHNLAMTKQEATRVPIQTVETPKEVSPVPSTKIASNPPSDTRTLGHREGDFVPIGYGEGPEGSFRMFIRDDALPSPTRGVAIVEIAQQYNRPLHVDGIPDVPIYVEYFDVEYRCGVGETNVKKVAFRRQDGLIVKEFFPPENPIPIPRSPSFTGKIANIVCLR